jgi:hypothetical protein
MNKWYGYLHTDGTIHAKRYFDMEDIIEANASDFVSETYGPFDARTAVEAASIVRDHFGGGDGD